MASTVSTAAARSHLLRTDERPRMAKADLRKPETDVWRARIGHAIERAKALSGLTLKEFADVCGRDERQVARWFDGSERPQLDAIFSAERLRHPLTQALAEMAGADVEVTVRMRRPA